MSIFEELLNSKRPSLSPSSIKTYESILRNLYTKVFGKKELNMNDFDKSDLILGYLSKLEPRKRKTILSALVIITDNKDYRNKMLDDIKEYGKEEAKQTKTQTQINNWVNQDELKEIYNTYKKDANLAYKKSKPSLIDIQNIQMYIILSLLGGFYIPPRRSKDYVNMKIKNIDTKTDNYIDKNELIFNDYKTAKTYGKQTLTIPKELKTILTKWIKHNPTDYLLFDTSGNKLTNVKLNQRLNKIFGKKAGVNQMRKTYLSSKYSSIIDTKNELDKDMKDMGSSTLQENIYIKK